MAKQKLSKAEKKQKIKEQRQEDALRSYRFRGLKNFLFWLSGMLTCLILIVSALFVGLKVIPIGTYLGSSANGYVSKDVSSKSIIDAFLKANTYDMSDFPVVADALDELIKGANLDEFVEIDVDRIKSLKFDGDFATELQSCVKVVATLDSVGVALGEENLLGDFGKLDVFSTWAEVDADNMPIDEDNDGVIDKDGGGEFLSNPKLYYYLKTTEPALLAAKMSSVGEYVRAFDDNGRYVDGYEGEKLYLANLSKVPILDIVDLIDESFGRLKLINILEILPKNDDLDTSLIESVFGDSTITEIMNMTQENIKISAFLPYKDAEKGIDNSYMYRILLQACGESLAGLDDADVEELASKLAINSFNEIDFNNVSVETFGLDESTLTLLLDAVNGKIEADNEKIDKGELTGEKKTILSSTSELTVSHLTSLDPNYITLSSILPYKDAEKGVDNSQLYKIILQACGHNIASLDDSEIEELASGLGINAFSDFNEQNITLNTILPVDATDDDGNYVNKSLYDILLDMVNSGKTGADRIEATEITLNDLSSFKTDSIRLSTILPLTQEVDGEIIDANRDLYNILSDVVNAPGATTIIAKEDITIAHLSNFVYSNIRLNTVLKIESNGALYDILNDIINQGKTSGQEGYVAKTDFTIASLSSFDCLKIRLNTVMPNNQALYDILLDVINGEDGTLTAEDITISHLSTFNNFDHVKLSTVLPYQKDNGSGIMVDANTALYSILLDVINGDTPSTSADYVGKAQIKLIDLSSFEFSNIKLNTVMPKTDTNQGLYKILLDVVNNDGVSVSEEKLNVGHLSSFDYNKMHLSTILSPEDNQDLYKVLLDVVNGQNGTLTEDDITLTHLGQFDVSKLHLKTVMEESNNTILSKLIDNNVKIGDLGTAIDGLSLYEIYGQNCFVEVSGETTKGRYKKQGDAYILDAEGEYVVSSGAGIWLFLCFKSEGIQQTDENNAKGCAQKYTISDATLSTLSDPESGSSISSKITNATIKQLFEAGILNSALPQRYAMSLQDVANGDIGDILG